MIISFLIEFLDLIGRIENPACRVYLSATIIVSLKIQNNTMKTILLLLLSMPIVMLSTLAQDCSSYFPFEEGKTWEMSDYNKKGKLTGTSLNTVSNVAVVSDGVKASVAIIVRDAKGKDEAELGYDMICSEGEVMISMNMFLPAEQVEQMKGYESMEVKLDMGDMAFPNDLTVGQELKDCSMTMEVSTNGVKVMSSTTSIKDRKVLEQLTVTTDAGDFDCFKITQTTAVSMGFISREYKSISYISEGVGVVRTENYDKKGNLDGYSELTKLN